MEGWPPSSSGNPQRSAPAKATPVASKTTAASEQPLIPSSVLDVPSQRLYISAFYLALSAWRLYDYFKLVSGNTDSLWLFMKWVAIDGVFFYSLPELQVPWLTWSFTATTFIFLVHAITNAVLMFRIPIPLEGWLLGLTKMLYDREIAVSERRVKPASLLHNPSLIVGKQIVNILPEGIAMLNPHRESACLSSPGAAIVLPIMVNQTTPTSITLLRTDLSTSQNETLEIPAKECKKLKKQADKEAGRRNQTSPRIWSFTVRQTGLYRLLKVIDESGLEVQRKHSDMLVVTCPKASIHATSVHMCQGDLSNFRMSVEGTPPLKVKYAKSVNGERQSHVILNVHPDRSGTDISPTSSSSELTHELVTHGSHAWAQAQHIWIPLNETLGEPGTWIYLIDEVQDGCGNTVAYSTAEKPSLGRTSSNNAIEQKFSVHERPSAAFHGCDSQNPLKLAAGSSMVLPIWLNPTAQNLDEMQFYQIAYTHSAWRGGDVNEGSDSDAKVKSVTIGPNDRGPLVHEPGRYSLSTVSTKFCVGSVLEPSSCLLLNPPEPELSISSEEIPHKCAGNPIGLKVSLDFIGTPPFRVAYKIVRREGGTRSQVETFGSMRAQIELKPSDAGHYRYEFVEMQDSVYRKPRLLQDKPSLEQDVKPTAAAAFSSPRPEKETCIGESVSLGVDLVGEPPWTLEYDMIQAGRRDRRKIDNITSSHYQLETPQLLRGGAHTLALTTVTDASGCRISLQQETQFQVRHQRPAAAFGVIEGERRLSMLRGKTAKLPLRLSGDAPWSITYRTSESGTDRVHEKRLQIPNDALAVRDEGVYEILDVRDATCPGSVDEDGAAFEVTWIARPTMHIPESSAVSWAGSRTTKAPVCEGDSDSLDIAFTGNAPFLLSYEVDMKPERGSTSVRSYEEKIASSSAAIRLEASRAGVITYRFKGLGDQLYDPDSHSFTPVALQQTVHSRPSAWFEDAGKTYNYCKESVENGGIPIRLSGAPPFSLEVAVRHHSSSRPETVHIPHIERARLHFQVPQHALSLGMHIVSIRKVRDSNGCEKTFENSEPIARINVAGVPSISSLEQRINFCVGERIAFNLAGIPPFNVFYTFEGVERRASASNTVFGRIAEKPGNFTITAISDKASSDTCRARTNLTKIIHGLPSVRVSRGKTTHVDIHEGGNAQISFEFGGSPPFEFTYTRSSNAARGKRSRVLETRTETSWDHVKSIEVSEEGTYEVVSIRDKFCTTGQTGAGGVGGTDAGSGRQLLTL